jgi:hypothetical protein
VEAAVERIRLKVTRRRGLLAVAVAAMFNI